MSTSKINSEIRGYKPNNSLDHGPKKNLELSEIHKEMSSQQSLSSINTYKDSNQQLKHPVGVHHKLDNTQSLNDTQSSEEYRSVSVTAEFSVENETLPALKDTIFCTERKEGISNRSNYKTTSEKFLDTSSQCTTQIDLDKTRASHDAYIDITPSDATPWLPDQTQNDESVSRKGHQTTDNIDMPRISNIGLPDKKPAHMSNNLQTGVTFNDINIAAHDNKSNDISPSSEENETGYDYNSDESNFEAFDDESPLLANSDGNLLATSSTIQNSTRKTTPTSELNDFDNRRFFRQPQGSSLRVTAGTHGLNDNDATSKMEAGTGDMHEFHEDSSSYYDKSDKDSPLHRYDYKKTSHFNKGEHQVGESFRKVKGKKSNPYPIELKKTGVSLVFMLLNFCATTISLALTHERIPDKEPLPDFLLDNVQNRSWGLTASEIVLQVNVYMAIIVVIMHKHRFIILRRMALILGLLYGYRAITMFVTNLPKADPNYFCADKAKNGITLYDVVTRAFSILSGFGLSMNGKHTYCGDYIYSGHTMTIILAHLIIQEYTSKRLWFLHWLTFILAILGIGFLVVGRGHYTIDIIVAYWLTTRLWWIYHSMASFDALQSSSVNSNGSVMNQFVKLWWWPLFRWFECNVRSGPLPNGFNLPLPAVCVKVCIRINKTRAKSKTIFPGAPTTDSAINAANFLVNNLSNLTNISGSGKNSSDRTGSSRVAASSKSKGRTTKSSSTNMGKLMSRTLMNHKQAEQ